MEYPLPIRIFQFINNRFTRPVLAVGLASSIVLLVLFAATGSLYPSVEIQGYENPLSATGQFLVFSLVSGYLLACMTAQVGASQGVVDSLAPILPVEHHSMLERMDKVGSWYLGVLAGLGMAIVVSIPWSFLNFTPGNPLFVFSIMLVFGQVVMWSIIGFILAVAENNAILLNRLGKLVKVDLFNLETLNPFGQAGLRAMLMVVGALAITSLQSIDQEFRWDNYRNPILVGVPAILMLMLVPIWSIHKRIHAEKQQELRRLDTEIAATPRSLDDQSLTRLNALLKRREHVAHLRNWPMDFSLVTRVVFYVLIPPLAWAGAALVELGLDSYLAG